MRPRSRGRAALAVLLLLGALPAVAQTAGKLFAHPFVELYFPLDTYADPVSGQSRPLYSGIGYGLGSALDYAATSWLLPFARGQYVSLPYAGGGALTAGEGDLGLGLALRPLDRLALRLDLMGGLASLSTAGQSGNAYAAGARLGLEYRLSPAWTSSASGGYHGYFGTDAQILSAFEAGLYLTYDLSSLGGPKPKVAVEEPRLDAVFPSLYAYYDDNAFGTVRIVNREDARIRDVRVSFNAGHYMDQPKVCAEFPAIERGASATVSVKALFTDSVLQITQGMEAKGEIIVEYSYLGSDRVTRAPVDFRLHHRNAITWSDDRRAAAFVSPTNPAALWFSKFASGIVRDRLRGDINKPLQYAIGMFEAERLYGLNYVVVPANDYSVKHGLKDYIDSVQFPHQTLSSRGGDCSDLAILFATLMQSVGVEAAFITIPGHIFAAFDTGMSEAEARSSFYDPGLLIYRDGRAWIPVEVTMVRDGFIKAWRVAAKEWYDSSRRDVAAFYTLPDCWKVYPPAAFPGVNPRFVLPSEADAALAFDSSLDRFVARETEPMVESLRLELAQEAPENKANELGILYAHYGMLKESWKQLSDSAKAGCQAAWTNLGNVAYLRKDFKLALSYFEWSHKLDPSDDNALLGMARCQYELEDFDASDVAYADLSERNPALAGRFGYLASIFGGEGRAWSLADRAATTNWVSTRKLVAAVAPAAAVVVAPAPAPAAAQVAVVTAAPAPAQSPAPAVLSPTVAPTSVSVVPTSPVVTPTSPVVVPTSSAVAPTSPVVVPTSPSVTPTSPVVTPTSASVVPTSPAVVPTSPAVAATSPSSSPTSPAATPTSPAVVSAPPAVSLPLAVEAKPKSAAAATPSPSAPPAISSDLPVDSELAKAAADSAAQRRAATEAARAAVAIQPSAAPVIASDLPSDRDIADKRAAAASAAPSVIKTQQTNQEKAEAPAPSVPTPSAVAPTAVAKAPTVAAPAAAIAEPKSAAPAQVPAASVPSAQVAVAKVAAAEIPTEAPSALAPAMIAAAPAIESAPTVAPVVAAAPGPVAPVAETAPAVVVAPAAAAASKEREVSAPAVADSVVPTSPGKELLLEGFGNATSLIGTWIVEGDKATQTDKDAFFAKLATPLLQENRSYSYSFVAKSSARGRGWVGLGIHLFTPKSYTLLGYGSGDSICVWLTRDPTHYTDDVTRLQLYRSTNDWRMTLIAEVPVAESIYDDNRFDISVDPAAGTLSVSLNGTERLAARDVLDLQKGLYVVFRALDTAEFSAFRAEAEK